MNEDQTIKQDDPQTTPIDEANPVVEEPEATEAKPDEIDTAGDAEERSQASTASEPANEEAPEIPPAKDPQTEEPAETTEEGTEESDVADEPAPQPEPDIPGSHWYVVHTYSGQENRVAAALKQRVESEHLENQILDILVPTQEKIEIRGGKKENVKEKIFPGYILVRMVLDDISWLAVRTTQGVTSFVGMSNKPTAIPDSEVKSIVSYLSQGAQPTYKTTFSENDTVKIIDGPFAEFIGKVESVDKERGKIKVLVSIFGRETPVELDFLQVAKL